MLKYCSTLLCIFYVLSTASQGQIVYREDFQSQRIPHDYILINADGQTVSAGLMQGSTEAWDVGRHPGIDPNNWFAMTSSKYGNRVQANDWMILPSIRIPEGAVLRWLARSSAIDPSSWESYEVLLSTGDRSDTSTFTPMFYEAVPYFDANTQNPWFAREVDLSTYAGEDVAVAFRGRGIEGFLLFIDDIEIRVLSTRDAELVTAFHQAYTLKNHEVLSVRIANSGSETISSLRLRYSIHETGQDEIQDLSGLNLEPGQYLDHEFIVPLALPNPGRFNILCHILNVNDQQDMNAVNDSIRTRIIVLERAAEKAVLFEKYTGTWCGHCPKGDVALKNLTWPGESLIKVAVHNSDVMAFAEADSITGKFAAGYPSASFDHVRFPGRVRPGIVYTEGWQGFLDSRLAAVVPVELNVAAWHNALRNELHVDVESVFLGAADGPFVLNVYVIEDSVYRGSAWNQRNYANTDPQWPDLFGLGDPISPFYHRNVVMRMLGGPWGEYLTSDVEVESEHRAARTFRVALDEEWNKDRLSVVAYIAVDRGDRFQREILNTVTTPVLFPTFVEATSVLPSTHGINKIFPNPASGGNTTVCFSLAERGSVRLDIHDLLGRRVQSLALGAWPAGEGRVTLRDLPRPSGKYLVRLFVDGIAYGSRLFIVHR